MLPETPTGLLRGIRRWDLVGLVINSVIGAGIFGLPSKAYALTGTYSLFALLVCAVFASLIILCFAEVSSRFTETGGAYLYAREALGPRTGFVIGWLMWLTRVTSFASICNLLVSYLAHFWAPADSVFWRPVLITAVVVVLTAINLVGVRRAAIASNILAISKLIPLVLFVVVGSFSLHAQNFSFGPPPAAGDFSTAVMLLVFAFGGFETATVTTGEVRNPQRNLPFALLVAMAVVVTLYLLIQLVCVGTVAELAKSDRPLADAASHFLGPAGASIIVLGALVSMTGILNASLLAGSRLPFAMAADGYLPAVLAATHARFRTPHIAILISAGAALVVSLTHSFMSALAISIITRLIIYISTCGCVFVLRRRSTERPAGFTVPGGAIIPLAALALCVWLLAQSSWSDARDVFIAASAGLAGHLVWEWRHRATAVRPHNP